MPRKAGGKRRKRRTHSSGTSAVDSIPRSFVFRRGHVPVALRDLTACLRTALMPHTARRLKERRCNSIRDYVSVATQIGVTHFWILSATATSPYLRVARVPQGPTLTFRVVEYSLSADVTAAQRRPVALEHSHFEQPPLLVLNNFTHDSAECKLMAETFRHAFPPIDVASARLGALKRVLLMHRDVQSGDVCVRHYALRVQQAGLSKPVRNMVNKRRIPKMNNLTDVSELMDGAAGVFSSDSEVEDKQLETVRLSQPVQNVRKGSNSKIKLVEVGPRLRLQLVKIQAGLGEGAVLYHRFVSKSKEEAERDEKRIQGRKELKRKRREEQEANVKRKQDKKRAKKERHRRSVEALKASGEPDGEHRDAVNDGNEADDEGDDSAQL